MGKVQVPLTLNHGVSCSYFLFPCFWDVQRPHFLCALTPSNRTSAHFRRCFLFLPFSGPYTPLRPQQGRFLKKGGGNTERQTGCAIVWTWEIAAVDHPRRRVGAGSRAPSTAESCTARPQLRADSTPVGGWGKQTARLTPSIRSEREWVPSVSEWLSPLPPVRTQLCGRVAAAVAHTNRPLCVRVCESAVAACRRFSPKGKGQDAVVLKRCCLDTVGAFHCVRLCGTMAFCSSRSGQVSPLTSGTWPPLSMLALQSFLVKEFLAVFPLPLELCKT